MAAERLVQHVLGATRPLWGMRTPNQFQRFAWATLLLVSLAMPLLAIAILAGQGSSSPGGAGLVLIHALERAGSSR